MTAENGYKVTADEIKEDVKVIQAGGTILDYDSAFWMRFVFNGQLNEEALIEKGYTEKQLPWIRAEMQRLGWL